MKEEKKTKEIKDKKTRKRRPFPTTSFQECFEFAKSISEIGAGQKVRRLTIFEKLGKSPDSGPTRALITNCGKYGLTVGSYSADYLELTEKAKQATNDELEDPIQLKAKFQLSFSSIEIYNQLYEKFVNNKLPSHAVISDLLKEMQADLEKEELEAIVDTFIVNLKYLGLLRTISGAERVISIDHALENLPAVQKKVAVVVNPAFNQTTELVNVDSEQGVQVFDSFDNICFYVTPIGEENSEQRKHSDLFRINS